MLVRCENVFCLLTCFRSERQSRSAVTIGICKIMTHFLSPSHHSLRKRQPYCFHLLHLLSLWWKTRPIKSLHHQRVGTHVHCLICKLTIYLFLVVKLLLVCSVALFCRAVCVPITSNSFSHGWSGLCHIYSLMAISSSSCLYHCQQGHQVCTSSTISVMTWWESA